MNQSLNSLKLLLESRDIKVLGSTSDPIFRRSDVLLYIDVNQYPVGLEDACTSVDGEDYITECGLYECLFAANSDKARLFRSEVIQLLITIRKNTQVIQSVEQEQLPIDVIGDVPEPQEETKQIRRHHTIRQLNDGQYNAKCDEMKAFYREHGHFPRDNIAYKGTLEYKLSQFFNKVKQARKQLDLDPNTIRAELCYALTPSRIQYIEAVLADLNITRGFWIDTTTTTHQSEIDIVKQYRQQHERYPVDNPEDVDSRASWNIVRKWRLHYKSKSFKSVELDMITSQLPDFRFEVLVETQQSYVDQLCDFIRTNHRTPLQKENRKLQTLFITMTKTPVWYDCTAEQRLFLTTKQYPELLELETCVQELEDEIPAFNQSECSAVRSSGFWIQNKEETIELLKTMPSGTWVIGDKTDVTNPTWFNYPIVFDNQFLNKESLPRTCSVLQRLMDRGLQINASGFCLLKVGGRLPEHTDSTGPTFDSMSCNILLRGKGLLGIKPSNRQPGTKQLELGKVTVFNSEQTHYAENGGPVSRYIFFMDFKTK